MTGTYYTHGVLNTGAWGVYTYCFLVSVLGQTRGYLV